MAQSVLLCSVPLFFHPVCYSVRRSGGTILQLHKDRGRGNEKPGQESQLLWPFRFRIIRIFRRPVWNDSPQAPLAQLNQASVYGREGCTFESYGGTLRIAKITWLIQLLSQICTIRATGKSCDYRRIRDGSDRLVVVSSLSGNTPTCEPAMASRQIFWVVTYS